ncbi:helix-turn-helix domain-containing protein [Streptosporangium sp. NPDC006930]|uniref:helix-turn-helix domain-containing protein n=1 Tax=Streptosporangium sp. NPDC006930 TaxID=3154783 RepID=UPI003435C723
MKFEPRPGFVVQAYRFALDPNATQEAALRSHCGAARAAYNWAVGWVSAAWWQRKAESTYGIGDRDLRNAGSRPTLNATGCTTA